MAIPHEMYFRYRCFAKFKDQTEEENMKNPIKIRVIMMEIEIKHHPGVSLL